MITSLKLRQRLFYFMVIGCCAALTHLTTVFVLVHFEIMPPLLANIFAFLIAFCISFSGHKHLTFSCLHDEKQLRLPHFFLVAASAGIINEGLYFILLRYTTLNYMIALFFVLGLVSVYTYILSRFWACR